MKFVIQRVKNASVEVDEKIVGNIDKGFLVLLGVNSTDTESIADYLVKKFKDEAGKMNLNLRDVKGELLLVSQFTLYADCKKGNRPSFTKSAKFEEADKLYEYIIKECRKNEMNVKTGIFGAEMKVNLINDGPVTIILDSKEL